jgi:hypothetical protein
MEQIDLLQHVIYKLNKYKSRYELCTDLEKKNIYEQKVQFYMKELENMEGGFMGFIELKGTKRINLIKKILRYQQLLKDLIYTSKSNFLNFYTTAQYKENQYYIIDKYLTYLNKEIFIRDKELNEIELIIDSNMRKTFTDINGIYNNRLKIIFTDKQVEQDMKITESIKTILEKYKLETKTDIITLATNFTAIPFSSSNF